MEIFEGSESISRSAQRFQTPLKAFRGVRRSFRGLGRYFAERAEVPEGSESIFAERVEVSNAFEGIARSA